jgi:hypothetical protein
MKGSLTDAHAELFAALEAIRDEHAPELNVYDLWRPDMALPAVWTWLAPGTVPKRTKGTCVVTWEDRIVVTVGVDPQARIDQDARRLFDYVQLLREHLTPVLYAPRSLGDQSFAGWASGQQLVQDVLGGAQITAAELPVALTLDLTFRPAES